MLFAYNIIVLFNKPLSSSDKCADTDEHHTQNSETIKKKNENEKEVDFSVLRQ